MADQLLDVQLKRTKANVGRIPGSSVFTNRFSLRGTSGRCSQISFTEQVLGVGLDPRQMPKVTESNWNMVASMSHRVLR